MSGAVFTLGNSVSGSLSLGSALSKFGRVAGQAGFTIEQDEETLNNTVTSRYAGLAAVTVSGVTSVLNPSLVLIPSAYNTSGSTGILYSLHSKPNGVADFVVTRATEGTRFNSVGRISTVGSGDARLDYYTSGGTVGPPALLVEASGSNLCLQSQDFTTTWSSTNNVTVSANVTGTTDPLGTNLAEQLFETTTSGLHFLTQTMSITSGTTYAGSIFYKKAAGSPDWMQVAFSTTGLAGFANFNLTSGTVGNVLAGCTGRIENYGNGWYRCTLIQTATASGTSGGPIPAFINNTNSVTRFVSYAGSTATSIYIFGAQLEVGTVPTSYIPTTTAPVTRNADVITLSGAVSGCIGQTEGTIYAEVVNTLQTSYSEGYVARLFADANNEVWIRKEGGGNTYTVRWRANSQNTTFSSVAVPNGVSKIAFAYKSGDTALYLNGSQVGVTNTDVRSFAIGPNSVAIGSTSTGAYFNDRIRAAALYTTRLTNAELAALTTL
jgi:hypothetical protein